MGAGGDGAGDLGEVGVHRRRVDEGQDQPCCGAACRADRTEHIRPLIAGVAGRAGSGATPGPDAGQGSLLTPARFILEPDLQRLVPCPRRDRCCYRFGEVFFERFLGLRVRLRVLRTHRQPPKTECRQLLGLRCAREG